jgi:DNA polymerase-3 subunit delta'
MPALSTAHLFVGSEHALMAYAITYIQKIVCSKQGCGTCTDCVLVQEKQHHALRWFTPEKSYTREQLEPLFHTIAFTLNDDQKIFFVLEHAECLTTACANSLLKSLEEPPAGYHFILLTDHLDSLLPTIRSRCAITRINSSGYYEENHPLVSFFISTIAPLNPAQFVKTLEQSKISEKETIHLLNWLLSYWITHYKGALLENDSAQCTLAHHMIETIQHAITHPPMPGSSKLVWKNLFMQIKMHPITQARERN